MTALWAPAALLPDGWAKDVRLEIGADGMISAVTPDGGTDGADILTGPVIPGMPNLHSHAFQRAMAGLAEQANQQPGSFWSWRGLMYRFAARLTPEILEAIAAQLYLEMVKAGYTAVCEFHYLHHGAGGVPYADPAEMSWRLDGAARTVGIGLTHLPVLYQQADFGAVPAEAGQARFTLSVAACLNLIDRLDTAWRGDGQRRVGIAPHSLRAVGPQALADAVSGFCAMTGDGPIHIHIAEQQREVESCLAWSGMRPVGWLLDHHAVDRQWCLVHATHLDQVEIKGLVASKATVGLCPTTEANLADGFFPVDAFRAAGGLWGIGSDSHVSVSPVEELRWLDYGTRLFRQTRASAVSSADGALSLGADLWRQALGGGAAASGRKIGALSAGYRADLVMLDETHPLLWGRDGDQWLDALVFSGNQPLIRHAMIGGRWRVRDFHHDQEAEITACYRSALTQLLAA